MLKYTVKRLLQSLVTIFLIATAVFLMMRCLPTDYYFTEEQLMKFTDQQKTAALEAAGLTDPIPTQLVKFYNNLLHLDFGTSRRIQNGATVVKVIGKKFGVSMRLGLIASGISLVVGVLMGILQAAFKDKVFDWNGLHRVRQRGPVAGVVFSGAGLWFQVPGIPHAVFHPQCECFQRAAHHLPFAGIHCRLCPVDPPLHGG